MGQVRVRKPFKDLSEAEMNFSTAIVDSFITVRPAHISVKKAVCPIQSVNILLALSQEKEDCYSEKFSIGDCMAKKSYCSDHGRRIVRICSANYLMDSSSRKHAAL